MAPPEDISLAVARFTHNGQPDTTFGSNGLAKLSGIAVTSMAVQGDGKVLIGDGFSVARLTASGKFDTTFGGGDGIASTEIFGTGSANESQLKLLPDGRTMIVGTASLGDTLGNTDVALVRYTAAGALDKTFGNGTGKVTTNFFAGEPGFSFDYGNTIAVRPDGGFYVGGSGDDGPWFASYNASGTLVRSAAVEMGGVPRKLTIGKGGKILAIGGYGINNVLARINPDLTLDRAFGPGGEDGDGVVTLPIAGNNLTAVPDGRFYVTGWTNGNFAVARYAADPVAPSADGNDQISEAAAIAVGGGVTQDVNPATDADVYKFNVKAGQRVGFDVDRTAGSTLDSYIRLFNASGAQAPGEQQRVRPRRADEHDRVVRRIHVPDGRDVLRRRLRFGERGI